MANVSINPIAGEVEKIKTKQNTLHSIKDTAARTALENVQVSLDSNYQTPTKVQELNSPQTNDNFQTAIQKLNNGIVGDEETWAAALNQIEDNIIDAVKLPSNYAASTGTNEQLIPVALETVYSAISKLHKAILDIETTWAAALNDLNDRVTNLES